MPIQKKGVAVTKKTSRKRPQNYTITETVESDGAESETESKPKAKRARRETKTSRGKGKEDGRIVTTDEVISGGYESLDDKEDQKAHKRREPARRDLAKTLFSDSEDEDLSQAAMPRTPDFTSRSSRAKIAPKVRQPLVVSPTEARPLTAAF